MQLQIWTDTNWSLIVAIVAGSAVLAYLGDVLGFMYGKQRISIFGLRPKYTSRLITAMTGIFISVVVLVVLSIFSESVRGTLFSMKYLQQQLAATRVELQDATEASQKTLVELTLSRAVLQEQEDLLQTTALSLDMARFDLQMLRNDREILASEKRDLEAEVASLRDESEELKQALDLKRLGAILIQANTLLAREAILPGTSREEALKEMDILKAGIRDAAAERLSEMRYIRSGDVRLVFEPAEESEMVDRVSGAAERLYIRALAAENVAAGESVKIRFESGRSILVYFEGEPVYRKLVDPDRGGFDAEETLHVFLRELRNDAVKRGILPDPATNGVGSLEGEDFFEAVEKLRGISGPFIINAIALQDLYTEGPVRIKIEIQE